MFTQLDLNLIPQPPHERCFYPDANGDLTAYAEHTMGKCNVCSKCRGTGEYVWGAIVNGVPTKRGMCFNCRGKGFVTPADTKRNNYYWDHRPLSEF